MSFWRFLLERSENTRGERPLHKLYCFSDLCMRACVCVSVCSVCPHACACVPAYPRPCECDGWSEISLQLVVLMKPTPWATARVCVCVCSGEVRSWLAFTQLSSSIETLVLGSLERTHTHTHMHTHILAWTHTGMHPPPNLPTHTHSSGRDIQSD